VASQAFASLLPTPRDLANWVEKTWVLGKVIGVELINLSENAMYCVTTDPGQRFVLRLSQPNYQTDESLEAELAWLQHLGQVTDFLVETAQVIAPRQGGALQQFPGDPAWRCVLFTYVNGSPIARQDVSDQDFRTLGAVAAQLCEHPIATANARPHWRPDYFLAPTYGWGNWRDASGIAAPVVNALAIDEKRVLTALLDAVFEPHLIHGDMRAANLLRCSRTEDDAKETSLALLDFDDAVVGPAVVDLAAALSFDEDLDTAPARIQAWIEGYQAVRPLPAEQVALIPSFVVLRRLSLLGWMTTHPQAPEATELGGHFAVQSVGLLDKLNRSLT